MRSKEHGDVQHPRSYRHAEKNMKEVCEIYKPSFIKETERGRKIFNTHRDNDGQYRGKGGTDGGSFYNSIRVPSLKASTRVWRKFKALFPFLYEDDEDGDPKCHMVEKMNGKRYLKTFSMNHSVGHIEVLIGAGRIKSTITRTKRYELRDV